ncbi:hypothetical protein SNOG_07632 [Parastagonospora nodorum SN15]|uniref:Uncharacterized protein n=1 Tax=Phaeosphaeria nodorum (strain SN15 / ATCC MYA-4574 / FGSC 10173) TaxID=321614 RepID=Q0UKT2_PHANO|nr:hypothetical protein SNOG_07632 [Parastagonospora nodorum SN15]EAT85098.1 hypothetical protein SNOG_07632 [Parastagonospora nodorum SN15]
MAAGRRQLVQSCFWAVESHRCGAALALRRPREGHVRLACLPRCDGSPSEGAIPAPASPGEHLPLHPPNARYTPAVQDSTIHSSAGPRSCVISFVEPYLSALLVPSSTTPQLA